MKLEYLHFADYAFLTDLGKVSLIGMFDRLQAKAFPTTHSAMFVVGQVGDISYEQELSLVIRRGKQEVFVNNFVANLQQLVNPLRTYNFLIGLHNFVFPEPGVYEFVVKHGDEEVGVRKLVVEQPMSDSRLTHEASSVN